MPIRGVECNAVSLNDLYAEGATLENFCMSKKQTDSGYWLWLVMETLRKDYNEFLTGLKDNEQLKDVIPVIGMKQLMFMDKENFMRPFVLQPAEGNDY